MRVLSVVTNLWHPESRCAGLAGPASPAKAFVFDPNRLYAPALHKTMDLTRLIRMPADAYVGQRDHALLTRKPQLSTMRPAPRPSLTNFSIYTLPGWGNFTFGAEALKYAHDAAGHGLTHISVAHDGTVAERSDFMIVGSPRTALSPEWVSEFRTAAYRVWYALKLKEHQTGAKPERELILGHSKGGLLVYLLACLVKSHKDGRLDEFVLNLSDGSAQPLLGDFPREALEDIADGLKDAVFGTIGSPLYGIGEDFAKFADKNFLPGVNFNALSDNSARYFEPAYLAQVHKMTGYKPNDVLDFVVTSRLKPIDPFRPVEALNRGAAILKGMIKAPLINGGNVLFKGVSRVISPRLDHDGVAPYDYPEPFKHHLRIEGATHLDQVEQPWVMQRIFEFMEKERLV